MTKEQSFFFQVLRDYLHRDKTTPPQELDWARVCQWADAHKLGGIFYVQCASGLRSQPGLLSRMNTGFLAAVSRGANLGEDYKTLRDAFDQAGIPYIPIKGILIAEHYPDPELRTMGDIDVLVRQEDCERIRDLLLPLGFENENWYINEWDYTLNYTEFELQAKIIGKDRPDEGAVNRYFNRFWEYAHPGEGSSLLLEPSFHFFYLIAHIAKHLRWVGVGFRQFYDLAVLMSDCPERYDWDWIRQQAEQIDFFRFTACALAMVERWFGVPSPYGTDCLSEELFQDLTDKIFADGVFGFENEANRIHAVEKAAQESKLPLPLLKCKTALRLAFPSYRALTTSKKYDYLRGRPYLLPYAWIRRAFRGRNSGGARDLSAVLRSTRSEVDARTRQMQELGL